METPAKYYHYLSLRTTTERIQNIVIGSDADNIDDAHRERCQIAKQHHPHKVASLTTHDVGMGPACR